MTKLSAEIISFDDAGADDDHPVNGITMGHIRRWFDRVEQHEITTLPSVGECTDEMAHAMSGLDGYDHDRDMPTLQRWKDYWDAAVAAHLPTQPQEAPEPTRSQIAQAFETIRLKLVNCLEEPERSAFWLAVQMRDALNKTEDQ